MIVIEQIEVILILTNAISSMSGPYSPMGIASILTAHNAYAYYCQCRNFDRIIFHLIAASSEKRNF